MPILSQQTKLFLVILLFLFGMVFTSVSAQETTHSVTMSVTPAYQGYFKYGEWLPVWVGLTNNGPDLEGEIQVKVARDLEQTTFAVPVSLPAGARKRLPVYVLPNNFSHELKVELVTDSLPLLTQTTAVNPQPNINYLMGVAANQRGALTLVPGIQLPGGRLPVPANISLDELPDRPETMRSLNALIINDIDTTNLTPDQLSALIGWVQQGGRLVIGGGAGALRTTAGLPEEILPLLPDDLTELNHVDTLAIFADTTPVRVPGPFVIATGSKIQGQTLVEQDGYPLVQEINLGEGYITFVALDLTTSPFNAWVGTTAFWEALFTPGAAYPHWMPPDMSARQMTAGPIGNALSNIPSLDLPSSKSIVFLLGIYILLVGPVNYLALRWRKKLHWGWVTIPAITLAFSVMSFGLGYAKRGTDLIIHKIAIIEGGFDGSAQITSYIGLFSPANQGYELEISGNNLLSPMSNFYNPWMSSMPPDGKRGSLIFVQGDPGQVRGLNVNQWSMQSFMTETISDDIGPLTADLGLEGKYLVGSIKNETGSGLTDVVVILKHNIARIGDIDSGETTKVKMELKPSEIHGATISWKIFENQFSPSTVGAPPREQEFKRMVLESVLDQQNYYGTRFTPEDTHSALELSTTQEVTIIGWMEGAPPEVQINGQTPQETATSLYKTHSTYQLPQQGEITIPPGLIPGLVAKMPFSAGPCGTENTSIWLEHGEAVMEFILSPELKEVKIDDLQFLIQTDGNWSNPPNINIYDWSTDSWQPLDKAIIGLNTIPEPGNNINTDGVIRFQLNIENQNPRSGWCYYTGLGLKGSY